VACSLNLQELMLKVQNWDAASAVRRFVTQALAPLLLAQVVRSTHLVFRGVASGGRGYLD